MNIRMMLIFTVLLSISPGLLLSSHAVEEIPFSTLQEGKLWEDIRIGVIVNKVEKAVVLPPEITEELSLFPILSPIETPKPSKGAGESDFWVIKLDVQGKLPEKIDTQNTGAINLSSTPSGAKVFLEAGQYIGKTPLTIDKVSPGKHKVTLVLADYEKYVQEVDVIAGKVVDVSATLVATRIQPTSRIWSLEGRFINFSSLCEFRNREPKLLSPQSGTYYKGTEWTITGCSTLDEKLLSQQPLAIIIKIHNSTDVLQALTLPLLSDLIVHTQTDSKPALAFYYPWGSVDLRGWVTELKGKIEAQVKAGTAMELLYLIPRFNGKAKIELLNIGSFEINEPK